MKPKEEIEKRLAEAKEELRKTESISRFWSIWRSKKGFIEALKWVLE